MTLAGTRPILPDELEQYELHHRARIAIKPGITGMWQVSGRSDITDFEEIVRLDTEYISEIWLTQLPFIGSVTARRLIEKLGDFDTSGLTQSDSLVCKHLNPGWFYCRKRKIIRRIVLP